jgi:hypothetical protein
MVFAISQRVRTHVDEGSQMCIFRAVCNSPIVSIIHTLGTLGTPPDLHKALPGQDRRPGGVATVEWHIGWKRRPPGYAACHSDTISCTSCI